MDENTINQLNNVCWSSELIADALDALASKSGLSPKSVELPPPGSSIEECTTEIFGQWLESAAEMIGLEAEEVETAYADAEHMVKSAGPALLKLELDDKPRFLALLPSYGNKVSLLTPSLTVLRLPSETVRMWICYSIEQNVVPAVDKLLEKSGVKEKKIPKVRKHLLNNRLGQARIGNCWLLKPAPGMSFWRQIKHMPLFRHLFIFIGSYILKYFMMIISWWLVGKGAITGDLDKQKLIVWALIILTMVPLGLLVSWTQSLFFLGIEALLKSRLLYGALRLDQDMVRSEGAGQLLGRVMESDAIGALVMGAGFSAVLAIIDIFVAGYIMTLGAGGTLHVGLFLGWGIFAILICVNYSRLRIVWTKTRMEMTNDVVERMDGHRTRLAQEERDQWHTTEDQILERYMNLSAKLDKHGLLLSNVISRGWMMLGLLGLAPAFISGVTTPGLIAISLGGILLAAQAIGGIVSSISMLTGVLIAWQQAGPLFKAATHKKTDVTGMPIFALKLKQKTAELGKESILEVRDLSFKYPTRSETVLKDCNLKILKGDRILLEGPSGGGKSTLGAILSGLRVPDAGLLLLKGLDRYSLGPEKWRQMIATSPQFQENHVLTGTMAFNLLMGRRWPALPEDLQEAEQVCHELGLGELLTTMPAGMLQVIGETGWRLSHGEQSRLFIARALLQRADLILLDESFAALDPANLKKAMSCVLKRAPAVLVIAHP